MCMDWIGHDQAHSFELRLEFSKTFKSVELGLRVLNRSNRLPCRVKWHEE